MTGSKVMLAAAGVLAMLATVGAAAAGSPGRVSRGDAEAVLQAFSSGGSAVRLHSPTAIGAPAQGLPGSPVAIRPFSGTPFDGAHYCALDWHAIVVDTGDDGSRQAVASEVAGVTMTFTLDGAPLPVTQTALRRMAQPELIGDPGPFYWTAFGRVMAPSDLAPGTHSLGVAASDSSGVWFTDGITFHIDPAGTGACL